MNRRRQSRRTLRRVANPGRLALLGLLRESGAAHFDGWNDEPGWSLTLPWPEETRSLAWGELDRSSAFLASILDGDRVEDEHADVPFTGGWAGFVSYEVGAHWEAAEPCRVVPDEPAAWFARHESGIVGTPDGTCVVFSPPEQIDELCAIVEGAAPHRLSGMTPVRHVVTDSMGGGAYQYNVEEIRRRIASGDVYQVNLTRRFEVAVAADPVGIYLGMTGDRPPRCSAILEGDGWTISSASPEVFLRFDERNGIADSRPIKGTVRRTGDDEGERVALSGSAKDAAEHLMIVDLVRNDLGKVAPPGGVSVPELKAIRVLKHVVHLESIVEARRLRSVKLLDLFRALFPGGSITGAPKRAAVHAIREIEPCARGVYTGAIGFIDDRGIAELSVGIRTAVITGSSCRYHAGGGIVWDSDPDAEDEESFAKSVEFLETLGV